MAYVITEPCIGVCDTSCVKVCPVACIHGPKSERELEQINKRPEAKKTAALRGLQMYIDPEACIDCAACVPECPVNAIYEAAAVPAKWDAFTDKNSEYFRKTRFSK